MTRPTKDEAFDGFMQVIGRFYAERGEAAVSTPEPHPEQDSREDFYDTSRSLPEISQERSSYAGPMFDDELAHLADLSKKTHAAWDAESEDPLNEELSERSYAARVELTEEAETWGEALAARIVVRTDAALARTVLQAAFAEATLRATGHRGDTPTPSIKVDNSVFNAAVRDLLSTIKAANERFQSDPSEGFDGFVHAPGLAADALVEAFVQGQDLVSLHRASLVLGEALAKVTSLAQEIRHQHVSERQNPSPTR